MASALVDSRAAVEPRPTFAERFAADSAKAGSARVLQEQRQRAERLLAGDGGEPDIDGALDAFAEMAEQAMQLGDRPAEAVATLGMADCLAKPKEVDDKLVLAMYRKAQGLAQEVGDAELEFRAAVGTAELQHALRRQKEAVEAWEAALTLARSQQSRERTAFAATQLGVAMLQRHSLDVVDENKQRASHLVYEEQGASAGARGGGRRDYAKEAAKLFGEVVELLPQPAEAVQAATARMNHAAALREACRDSAPSAVKLQQRRAEKELVAAWALLEAGEVPPQLRNALASQLVELYDEEPWLLDGDAAKEERLASCRRRLSANIVSPEPAPEQRRAAEMAAWAQQKMQQAQQATAADSDSDDDAAGPAHPKGEDWRK